MSSEIGAVAPAELGSARVPVPAKGLEFLGPFHGSGFRRPRYLVRRADGQVAQLPDLLYRTAQHVDGRRDLGGLAALLRDDGHDLTAEQVGFLVEDRLVPAGLVAPGAPAGGGPAPGRPPSGRPARGDHLFMLRLRTALVPESMVWRIAGPLRPLFRAPLVVVVLAAFVAIDVAVVAVHGWDGLLRAGREFSAAPSLTLAVLGVIVVAGVFHEVGHVTACRYGGATPGSMGVGVYLVWPAFYSTVTDAYRLSRTGRLRTDLGGVYFNAIVLSGLGAGYLATGQAWLLAALVVWHVETAWQFLPSLRLDGYYILADLVGVPDLFNRMRPLLRGLWRRDYSDPLVADLKPWVRRVVTAWVLLVVPFLLYFVVLFAVLAPQLAPVSWRSLTALGAQTAAAVGEGRIPAAVLDSLRIVLLVLPWAAGTYLVLRLLRRITRWMGTGVARLRRSPAPAGRAPARRPPPVPRPATPAVAGASRGLWVGLSAATIVVLAAAIAGVVTHGNRTPIAMPEGSAGADVLGVANTGGQQAGGPDVRGPLPVGVSGPPTLFGRVITVLDPATVVVDVAGQPVTVQVVGVDTAATPVCAADDATEFARRMLADAAVTLVPDPTLPPPAQDAPAWPAYLVLDDQQSYTDAAITAGWAGAGQGRYRTGFLAEQDQAQRENAGMWGPPCDRPV